MKKYQSRIRSQACKNKTYFSAKRVILGKKMNKQNNGKGQLHDKRIIIILIVI